MVCAEALSRFNILGALHGQSGLAMNEKRKDMRIPAPLLFSGIIGLGGNFAFFLSASLFQTHFVPVLLHGWMALLAFLFCLTFSLAEIPMMIFALRKLAGGSQGASQQHALVLTNVFYVLFAAVYAGIYVLLTGEVVVGGGLSALGIVRFFSTLCFVRLHPEEI